MLILLNYPLFFKGFAFLAVSIQLWGGNYHKISPRPSFPKRGIVPPFGKGRLGGIFPTITILVTEGLRLADPMSISG
jgi:hypothetical protein